MSAMIALILWLGVFFGVAMGLYFGLRSAKLI